MMNNRLTCAFVLLCFLSSMSTAAGAEAEGQGTIPRASQGNQTVAPSAKASAPASLREMSLLKGTMCTPTDKVIFSCPLEGGKKIVSICAAGGVDQKEGYFYYVYGRPFAPELMYPPENKKSASTFTYSHLVYGGATGGAAYSFVNNGYKYIVYSISGTGIEDGGVLVQRVGASRAARDMKCKQGKITESEDEVLIKAIMKWKPDVDIEAHGLPGTN